ncbi:STAS domain-containing protein [Desulfobotulus sp. H1]|uniref:STAS domain-containing protein n=1 Tax=Desulfobotulus pelophilus TaxID=2823377 RepID=A0ABT3N9M1_9BACT|nr:STAS domain-containing protein [Desulfobotulus pelophilus]MCW7754158.1 STAS domain-containing protein [Desulfobotulus pelophilus]
MNPSVVHQLTGHATIYDVKRLRSEMIDLMDKKTGITLDCSEIVRCDTAFLQLVLSLAQACKKQNIFFSIIPGAAVTEAGRRAGMDFSDILQI